jgi:hypothetical protein
MEAMRSSVTSVHIRSTLRYIPNDGILQYGLYLKMKLHVLSRKMDNSDDYENDFKEEKHNIFFGSEGTICCLILQNSVDLFYDVIYFIIEESSLLILYSVHLRICME